MLSTKPEGTSRGAVGRRAQRTAKKHRRRGTSQEQSIIFRKNLLLPSRQAETHRVEMNSRCLCTCAHVCQQLEELTSSALLWDTGSFKQVAFSAPQSWAVFSCVIGGYPLLSLATKMLFIVLSRQCNKSEVMVGGVCTKRCHLRPFGIKCCTIAF